MNEELQIDLGHRLFNLSEKQLIKHSIETIHQRGGLKGIHFYHIIKRESKGKKFEKIINRHCSQKIILLRLNFYRNWISVSIAGLSLLLSGVQWYNQWYNTKALEKEMQSLRTNLTTLDMRVKNTGFQTAPIFQQQQKTFRPFRLP